MSIGQALDIQALRDPLAGERVLVRPFTYGDISEAYLGWLRDPEVVRFSSQRFRVHTLETCQAYQASFKDSANHFLAICDRTSGAMLGTLTVYRKCAARHRRHRHHGRRAESLGTRHRGGSVLSGAVRLEGQWSHPQDHGRHLGDQPRHGAHHGEGRNAA